MANVQGFSEALEGTVLRLYGAYGAAMVDGTAPTCDVGDEWDGYVITAKFYQQSNSNGVKALVRAQSPFDELPGFSTICADDIRDLRQIVFWLDYSLHKMLGVRTRSRSASSAVK